MLRGKYLPRRTFTSRYYEAKVCLPSGRLLVSGVNNDFSSRIRPPYTAPADSRRPYGAHRFDVYSLKAKRRLTLFGVRALGHWVGLEADPAVTRLCERPLVIRDARPHRVVDFWVHGPEVNKFVLLLRDGEVKDVARRRLALTAFQTWAADAGCTVEELPKPSTPPTSLWLGNWIQVLQQISSYEPYIAAPLMRRVEEELSARKPMHMVLEAVSDLDAESVRAAICMLVHRGTHRIVDLDSQPLSDDLEVEPR